MKQLAVLLLVVIVAGALLAYSQWRTEPPMVSGLVEAHEIRVGSRVGGRVLELHVQEGQEVDGGYLSDEEEVPGQLLVTLEPYDLHQRRAEAVAELTAVQQEYQRLQGGFRQEEIDQALAHYDQLRRQLDKLEAPPRKQERAIAEEQLAVARTQAALTQKSFERIRELFRTGAATQEDLDRVTEELNSARGQVTIRSQELSLLIEGARQEDKDMARAQMEEAFAAWQLKEKGYQAELVAQAAAAVQAAEAALALIDQQIAELTVRAPYDAGATEPKKYIVEAVEIQPGDLVTANAPVLSLMDAANLWVRAYVPENRLNLVTDEEVWVTVDSYPGERFRGKVTHINRQAEFTPSNVQTIEERSKQVFRIKVTLLDGHEKLRPGMAADVWLEDVGER